MKAWLQDHPNPARRRLLLASGGLLGLSLSGAGAARTTNLKLQDNPFALGVASGEPAVDGFVIWTRLAPQPSRDGGMPNAAVEVLWELAEDPAFRRVIRQGITPAEPAWAHSVHVELYGLRPGRDYWYRFTAAGYQSPVGRALTLPPADAAVRSLRFAYASCQHYESGYYAAYRHLVDDDPELILHLGDYIYESSRSDRVRQHEAGEPRTLPEYRNRHAHYRLDPDLQRAHAHCCWLVTWDDHEVQNDYAGLHSSDGTSAEAFALRRAAAYQAYWEHMPLRLSSRPTGPDMRLYRSVGYGQLLQIQILDSRQYRSDQACGTARERGGRVLLDCPERLDPQRTLLGPAQERWLLQSLGDSPSRWNLIAQQMLMAPVDQKPGPGHGAWSDGWDGYPAARARILQHLHSRRVANPVVIGGDIHSFWATDLQLNFDEPGSAVVATEFVGTSISSTGVPQQRFSTFLAESPAVRYFEARKRGYVRGRLSPAQLEVDFVGLDDVRDPDSAARVMARFAVDSGQAGVQRA